MLSAADFLYPMLLLFAAAGFWGVVRVDPNRQSARWFGLAYLAGAVAFIMEIFRFAIPDPIIALIAGGAFNMMTLGFVVGLILRADRKPPMKILSGICVLMTFTGAALSLTTLPVSIRICLAQFFSGLSLLIGVVYCRDRLSAKIDRMIMTLMVALTTVLLAAPIVSYLIGDLPHTAAEYEVSALFSYVRFAVGSFSLAMAMLLVWEYVAGAISDLRRLANRDNLTSLLNRRGFETKFADLRATAQLDKKQVALILLDLDAFKDVNDRFGHGVGDAALKSLADLLEVHCGEAGIAARLGGEEFVIALPVSALSEAIGCAEQVRTRWQRRVHYAGDNEFSSTVSIGVALNAPRELTASKTLVRADEALYLAKNSGRNKVISETDLNVAKLRSSVAATDSARANEAAG